jgi:hypothetical protein
VNERRRPRRKGTKRVRWPKAVVFSRPYWDRAGRTSSALCPFFTRSGSMDNNDNKTGAIR